MRIAVPHAPSNRRIGFCERFEYCNAVHWCQVESAIGRRQENAKKPGGCEIACEIFRQPSVGFDSIALCDNPRLEVASGAAPLAYHRASFPPLTQ
jgi:hypothetical protein